MKIPTLPPHPQVIRTIAECRAIRAQAIEYIQYASDNLSPDQCDLELAARIISHAMSCEYFIVGNELNPGDPQWHPFHDRATHDATVARMAH
jgi:hypothetical protein